MTKTNISIALFLLVFTTIPVVAQEKIIDRIIAVVGDSYILQSELDKQLNDAVITKDEVDDKLRCKVLEELLYQKLLLAQAKKDSLVVTEEQIEQEMNRRMMYYLQQFGSEEKFSAFYGKSVDDFKIELREGISDILLEQKMQSKIVDDVNVTPSDVKEFFYSIPADSIPFINSEVEVAQIVKKPKITALAKKEAKDKIEGLRQRIVKGEASFSSMAALYSMDPGSSNKGGLYENIQRGQFVPEWDAWAFKLKPMEVSEVFETVYGYFIIQLIERRGDVVDARSILISPAIESKDLYLAKASLDSIYTQLLTDTIPFSDLVLKKSDDDDTKHNGGLIVNPFSGSTRFQMDQIGQMDQTLAFAIEKLKVGEFTKPMNYMTNDGKQAFRILYLKTRTEPHLANLKDDYQSIQAEALVEKQQKSIQEWVKKKSKNVYVHLADDFKDCQFNNKWIN